jgi:HD-like signal output (HDOD) protein
VEAYLVYKQIIQKILLDPEQLPALPAVTLKIRSAINDPMATNKDVAAIITADPAFSALLMASVKSAIYLQANPPKTLEAVLSVLGIPKVSSLAMAYSVKSLFTVRNPQVKQLYQTIWQRMMLKAGTSAVIARHSKKIDADESLLAALLTEVGTLAILSTLANSEKVPDKKMFFQLCREYSKSFGAVMLKKWEVDEQFIECLKYCGRWNFDSAAPFSVLDTINLGLYCTVRKLMPKNQLPPLESLSSYKKIPIYINARDDALGLKLVEQKWEEVEGITAVLAS